VIYNKDINSRLRLVDNSDIDFLLTLRADPEIIDNLNSFVFLNQQMQDAWIASLSAATDKKYLIFEQFTAKNWNKIGLVRIDCIDFINRSMRVGGDIHKDFRGQGLSKTMYSLIFKFGFDTWNFNRLWLFLIESNTKAFNLYKNLGFQEEGIQKQAVYKNGIYINNLMMSLLKSDYETLRININV
jgi:diamine N-acetyltransferase